MRILILVEEGPSSGRRWVLRPGDNMIFGRTEGSDIVIDNDSMMSSCHFRCSVGSDGCTIEDLESTNGTLVNGQRVRSRVVADGDSISAGGSVFTIKLDSAEVTAAPPDKAAKASEPAAAPSKRAVEIDNQLPEKQEGELQHSIDDKHDALPDDAGASAPVELDSTPEPKFERQSPARHPFAEPADDPSDLRLRVSECPSGAWRATQTQGALLKPVSLIGLLSALCPIRLIIDCDRCQIDAPDESISGCSTLCGALWLVGGEKSPAVDWVAAGWGRDSIVVLFSYVGIEPMIEHFRDLSPSMPFKGEELSRPSALQDFLTSGPADLVAEVLVPCEAVLIETPPAEGGWRLFGNNHLIDLLTLNGIDFLKE